MQTPVNFADTPQAASQIGIEADITQPGVLMPFPALIQVDNMLNLDSEPLDDVGCPVCGSWTAAYSNDGTCENPQCATKAKTPR